MKYLHQITLIALAAHCLTVLGQVSAQVPSDKTCAVVGAWYDSFDEDAFVIFFADGRVIFSFIHPPEKKITEWHTLAKWRELRPGAYEVTFATPRDEGSKRELQKDVFMLHPESSDVLISPHASTLKRVGAEKVKNKKQ